MRAGSKFKEIGRGRVRESKEKNMRESIRN